jgi:hypothetical protein
MTEHHTWQRGLLLAMLILTLAALGSTAMRPAAAAAQPPMLIEFEIEDQFERERKDSEFRETPLVVVAAGRKGREFTAPWGDSVREALARQLEAGQIAVLPVADLRGVPGFMKKRVRGRFPEQDERWVLMDWKGKFAQAYDLDEEAVSMLLFDSGGALITRTTVREVNEAQLQHIVALVGDLLAS